jgi:signal transduction histidine kinase
LTSYGMALAKYHYRKQAFDKFEASLKVESNNPIALFLYTTVLDVIGKNDYQKAIANIESMTLSDLPKSYLDFLAIVLGRLYYLTGREKEGHQCFDLVIKHAKHANITRLKSAKHILAIKPYSQHGIDLLKQITEDDPNYTQALKMLSLNLGPEEYFEMFKTHQAESALTDTEMFNQAMYHKILNEISMLQIIARRIVANDKTNDVLSLIIQRIEGIVDKMAQLREKEKADVAQIPTSHYHERVKIISKTAHDIADIVNNELAIIKRRIQRVLKSATQTTDRFYQKLQKLLMRVESTETALNDLKSINEGIKIRHNSLKVKELFEKWQTTPTLKNATLSCDIQNGESAFVGDAEKIKGFLSELVENSLKHNAEQPDLQITMSSKDVNKIASGRSVPGDKKHLHITFSDNGKGIPPDKKEWIFLPLETTSKEGSGLGLFIIKRILKEMNGHIIETGQQGAHFEIDIPYGE